VNALAISQSTFAIATVVGLVGIFALLLAGSFIRARRASRSLAAAGESPAAAPRVGTARPAAVAAPAGRGAAGGGGTKRVISRRDFFRGGLLASLGVFTAQFGAGTLAFLWPNIKGGFGSVVDVGNVADIRGTIEQSREPFYFGAGRFYITSYSGPGTETVYSGLTQDGLMALYQKCVHLGCRVPFCQQSQWFECPCHGSKYNHAGEYRLGPAPRGMDRFQLSVDGGRVRVDTSIIILGPPRGTDTINQAPEGPFCVGG
jgi:cytochrome b6-f complex iron-sulfur subunit